jgi:predicted porin
MKKSLVALVLAGFAAAPAYAQWTMTYVKSSAEGVTIFGVLDQAIESANWGDGHATRLIGGGYTPQRFGVRGIEDLGGGARANFWLEASLGPDVGTGGVNVNTPSRAGASVAPTTGTTFQQWDRNATVGLYWPTVGAINFGRQNTPWFAVFARGDAFRVAGVGTPFAFQFPNMRVNNAIRYDSPTWGGLQVLLIWAVGDQGGAYGYTESVGGAAGTSAATGLAVNQKASGRQTGFGLIFDRGPWQAGLGCARIDGIGAVGAAAPVVLTTQCSANAAYNFGMVKVLSNYSAWHNDVNPRTLDKNTWTLQASFPFGPHAVIAGYQALKDKVVPAGGVSPNARQLSLQYAYSMSKRTTLYATYAKIDNRGAATYTLSANPFTNNAAAGFGPSAFQAGVNHVF